MKAWNTVRSLFETAPPPPPPSREELQARLEKVQGYIRENQREFEIGSIFASWGHNDNIARLRQEERQLTALLTSTT